MIKVFTSGNFPYARDTQPSAGDDLTQQFQTWVKTFEPNGIKIESIHTNSNEYGWMLTVLYSIVKP
jgi:hypothetical protein